MTLGTAKMRVIINFLSREIFRGNLNEAISLFEIDVTFQMTSISANKIASFRFLWKISLKRKLWLSLGDVEILNGELHFLCSDS